MSRCTDLRPSTFQTRSLLPLADAVRVAVSAPFRQRLVVVARGGFFVRLSTAVGEINNPNAAGPAGYSFSLAPGIPHQFIMPPNEALFAGAAGPVDLSVAASEAVFDCCDAA